MEPGAPYTTMPTPLCGPEQTNHKSQGKPKIGDMPHEYRTCTGAYFIEDHPPALDLSKDTELAGGEPTAFRTTVAAAVGVLAWEVGDTWPTPRWRVADQSTIDYHPIWVFTTGADMADVGREGAVYMLRLHYRSRGLCTCASTAKPCLFLASAKVEAQSHAARHGCELAVPLIQPGVMTIFARRGVLAVESRQALGGQPPQVNQRRGPRQAPCRHSSSKHRGRAVPHPIPNRFLQLTDPDVAGFVLRLTDRNFTGNAIASGRQRSVLSIGSSLIGIFTATRLFRTSGIET
jgi:hypothetical protein